MCEIFPEINNCCLCISARLALHFIAVICVMTGVISMSIMIKKTDIDYIKLQNITKINVKDPNEILSNLSFIVTTGAVLMSAVFMASGMMLFFASIISENEGFVQVFVWAVFLNVLLGFFLLLAVGIECVTQEACLLADMDWLTSSAVLIGLSIILFGWIYYISIANTYVVGE